MIKLIPTESNFKAGVKFAKDFLGLRFDPATKVWFKNNEQSVFDFVDDCKKSHQTREQYLAGQGLRIIEINGERIQSSNPHRSSPVNVATTYRGQASMDDENSIF